VNYAGPSHPQNNVSPDDLPKTVARSLNQGSCVMSMDFHPIQQSVLLGTFLISPTSYVRNLGIIHMMEAGNVTNCFGCSSWLIFDGTMRHGNARPRADNWSRMFHRAPMIQLNSNFSKMDDCAVGTNVGDIGIWEVGSREKLAHRTFKVWDITAASMPMKVGAFASCVICYVTAC